MRRLAGPDDSRGFLRCSVVGAAATQQAGHKGKQRGSAWEDEATGFVRGKRHPRIREQEGRHETRRDRR